MICRFFTLVLFLCATSASANEAQIRKALEPKLGGAKIEGVQPAPIAGLWEVRFRTERGLRLLYTDAAGNYVIDGNIHDLRTNKDLTEERLRKLNAIKFESLPLDLAVKVQRGNGKRVLAMFSDPYCPACRQFERTLAQIDDITVYVFMYPVIRPENTDHSRAVWCSPDRAKAWLELAAAPQPKVPAGGRELPESGRQGDRGRPQARREQHADADLHQRRAHERRPARRGPQGVAGPDGNGSPIGQSSHILPCWRMRPACAPASAPVPQ